MVSPAQKSNATLCLLLAFILMWLYTEVAEHFARDDFTEEVQNFIESGDRYTSEQGYNLCVRVRHLETTHHGLDVPLCERIANQ